MLGKGSPDQFTAPLGPCWMRAALELGFWFGSSGSASLCPAQSSLRAGPPALCLLQATFPWSLPCNSLPPHSQISSLLMLDAR